MTLNEKYYGRTLREWSEMTEAQRLADPQIGPKRLKQLNAKIGEALAVQGTLDAAIATQPKAESAAAVTIDVQKDETTVVTNTAQLLSQAAETLAIPPVEAVRPIPQTSPQAEPPKPLTHNDVFQAAAAIDASGFINRNPKPKLSAEQAILQARLYAVLTDRGMKLNNQGDVYGWLLDEVAASVLGS